MSIKTLNTSWSTHLPYVFCPDVGFAGHSHDVGIGWCNSSNEFKILKVANGGVAATPLHFGLLAS